MTTRRFSPRRVAVGAVVVLLGILASPLPARADQIADKQAQAAQIAARIDALGLKESALSEQYDKAVLDQQAAAARVAEARSQVQKAAAEEAKARQQARNVAIESYIGGGVGALGGQSGAALSSVQQQVIRTAYLAMFASNRQDAFDRYRTAAMQANSAEARLAQAQSLAAARVQEVKAAEQQVQAAQQQLQATYAQVKGQLAVLVAQAQAAAEAQRQREAQAALARQKAAQQAQLLARQQAARQAAALQSFVPPATSLANSAPAQPQVSPPADVPAPSGSAAAVAVAAAKTRLGDPYVWGAAGPDSFDCSGLTMWAWARAGVYLPHYSGAQYAVTTHIPMSDLQPGDLVFFADPGEHEAMYIGNGEIIEAPHTGAVVRIVPLYSEYVLASRP